MLDNDNKFLKWGAIITLGNLAAAAEEGQFSKIYHKYYDLIRGEDMVAASNVIGQSAAIAAAIPELQEDIVKEILAAEEVEYLHKGEVSPECHNVICGQMIDTFMHMFPAIRNKEPVLAFVKRQQTNPREKVRKKAGKFLKKYATP